MKKFTTLFIGLSILAVGGLLSFSAGCKMPQWTYIGNKPPGNPPEVAADLAYGYRLINVGASFPDIALDAPERFGDRSYLGLTSDLPFSIMDIEATLVLVDFLNIHCVPCQEQAPIYNDLYEFISTQENSSANRIKMLGVGVGNIEAETEYFRNKYNIPFPIVADPRLALYEAIGRPRLPFSVLVRLDEKSNAAVVGLTYARIPKGYELFYEDLKTLETLDVAVIREKGATAEPQSTTAAPPVPEPEIAEMIQATMADLGEGEGGLTVFRRVAIEDRHVYNGLYRGENGAKWLFAEVVSRPTLCDVCSDVHFFYIFDQGGKVLSFAPLQLTKWGNETWSEEDIAQMRDRLVGRFIFTPFYFNPEWDAVSSATISSAVIFNAMSDGKALFGTLKQKGLL